MVWIQIDVPSEIKSSRKIIILSKSLSHFQFLKMKIPGPKFYSFDRISHPRPISKSTIDPIWHDWGGGSLISVGGSPQQKAYQTEMFYFQKSVPFSNMKFTEHKFDRLDEISAQKPISHLIDDNIKPNWGTGSQNPE